MMAPSIRKTESFNDLKLSWQLFLDNCKAFIATELFSIIAFLCTILVILSFILLSLLLFPSHAWITIFLVILIFGFNFIFYGFLSCQYGLAHDIMCSGDMFTEFQRSFTYFRRYWWQYSLITLLISLPTVFSPISTSILNTIRVTGIETVLGPVTPVGLIIYFLIEYIWFILFVELYPIITSHGNLKNSFIQNLTVLKGNFTRISVSIGFYYLIFKLPILFFSLVSLIYGSFLDAALLSIISTMNGFFMLIASLLGPPIVSLIATRIYISLDQ